MRFTAVQAALFKAGVSFVHMAPTPERARRAVQDFKSAISGVYTGTVTESYVYSGDGNTVARFMVCTLAGASTNHVPVIFMDGKKSEFKSQQAYDESRHIPAEIDGCGPMVVR